MFEKLKRLLFPKLKPLFSIYKKRVYPSPTPSAPPQNPIEQAITKRLIEYGGEDLPALRFVPQFVKATERYPIFKYNPFLLPQLSILETSGGRNITRAQNLLNWGVAHPANEAIFSRMSKEDVLERAISGLGERESRYQKFRKPRKLTEEELAEFASIYEPANKDYARNLIEGIKSFEKYYLSNSDNNNP